MRGAQRGFTCLLRWRSGARPARGPLNLNIMGVVGERRRWLARLASFGSRSVGVNAGRSLTVTSPPPLFFYVP